MESAFALEAKKARVFLAHARLPAPSGVDVADRYIALLPERVIRQVVLAQIAADIAVTPVGNRMHFPAAVFELGNRRVLSDFCLLPAQARKPSASAQLTQGPLHRLDFAQLVVALDASHALLPEPTIASFHPGPADRRAIHTQVQR